MVVILNSDAGMRTREKATTREIISRAFNAAEITPRIIEPTSTRNLAATIREAMMSADQTIVAAGGDGTISAVATQLVNTDKRLGVLPIGTLNHFAKDLSIPLNLDSAVRTIVEGHVKPVDAAEVNGRIFINNSSLGIYPRIVSGRDAQQQRLARGKWAAFAWATVRAFRRFPFLDLQITVGERQIARKTAFLFVGNNEYEIAGLKLGGRACLTHGMLGLYLTHRTGRLGLLRLALHALFGRVNEANDFDALCVKEALIESRQRRLLVAADGEIAWMETPLRYRTLPGSLTVLTPRMENPG
jgi:YegS/Rv2252/BmrU family lipid kinase